MFIGSHTRIRVSYYVQGINIRFSGLILGSRILYNRTPLDCASRLDGSYGCQSLRFEFEFEFELSLSLSYTEGHLAARIPDHVNSILGLRRGY